MDPVIRPERVAQIAEEAHGEQVDLGGHPFTQHVYRVVDLMMQPKHAMIAALHHVIESSDWTPEDLFREGVPLDVLVTLRLLTRDEGQPYAAYIEGLTDDLDAVVVKIGCLKDDMDVTRLPALEKEDFTRLKKYHKAHIRLHLAMNSLIAEINARKDEKADYGTKH